MREWKAGPPAKFHVSERSLPLGRFTFHLSPFTNYQLPITNYSLPITHYLPHLPLLLILLLHFALALAYAHHVPLGEAPDEPAHLSYARFIVEHARLPASLAERQEAGYRSAWPPLYHLLVAGPLALAGDAPPDRLKAVGDTPRRLIPTDGQTIAAFIHTADESRPWRGLPLAWHLGRLVSVALATLAVTLTYAIAWRLTRQRPLAAAAAALHAFIPQVLFIGGALNDDNLLACLAGLVFLSLIDYTIRPTLARIFFLGILLGLATITKYNALPLLPLALIWLGWLEGQRSYHKRASAPPVKTWSVKMHFETPAHHPLASGLLFCLGVLLTGGWWFVYIWANFNQVQQQGWLSGSLAALSAGASDASLRRLAAGSLPALPPASAWLEWFVTLFETFWGSFGGGSAIDLPPWVYGLLALMCLVSLLSLIVHVLRFTFYVSPTPHPPLSTIPYPLSAIFLLAPLFFLPLPMLRFALTGSLVETAQGRHLFPALPAIAPGLVWGVSLFTTQVAGYKVAGHRVTGRKVIATPRTTFHAPRFTPYASRLTPYISCFIILLLFLLSLYSLNLIQAGYPPPIPLRTTAGAATAAHRLNIKMAESITLIGYEIGEVNRGVLPVTLVWQADAIPPDDYLIELTLTAETGQPVGGWLGHPLGGRYPTRAWDEGDILRHTVPLPLLPGLPPSPLRLTLRLLDSFNQPTIAPLTLAANLPTLRAEPQDEAFQPSNLPTLPSQLRADELSPGSPFTYRSTLSFVLPGAQPPELIAPDGQTFPPAYFLPGPQASLAHFIVAPNWPGGDYQFIIHNSPFTIPVTNRARQFEPPPITSPLNANFANTLTLLGYDLPQRRIQPGATFPITLHWQAERPIGRHLIVFNHLLDPANIQRGGADRVPQLYYTTLLWSPGEIVSDAYDVPVAAGAPPGIYWLDVGLYPADQPTFSLPLFKDGQPIDRTSVRLGPLKVGGPPPGVTVATAHPQNPLHLSFGDQITLLGFDLSRANNNPKSKILPEARKRNLKLYWRADTIPAADYTVFIHLLDPAGNRVAQFDGPPAAGAYPTSLWDPGEIIADEHRLDDLPPGHYTLQIGLYRLDTGQRLPVAGSPDGAVNLVEFEIKK